MMLALVTITALLLSHIIGSQIPIPVGHCFEGTYTHTPPGGGKDVCELCPNGTYMNLKDHTKRECFPCTKIVDPNLEILITPCNRTQDAVIHCVAGYYRQMPRNHEDKAECKKCTKCAFPKKDCETFKDTHCCPGENYDIQPDNNGIPLCRERSWLCMQGQYYDSDESICKPCPDGSFMSLDYHSMPKCWECQEPLGPLHSVILHPCNSTHPHVIGCKKDYFINHTMGYKNKKTRCSPCTNCSEMTNTPYVGRQCDQHHDTVCCPHPNMTVNETTSKCELPKNETEPPRNEREPLTETPPEGKVCGVGQYVDIIDNKQDSVCEPCIYGSYMDERHHNKTECKKCPHTEESQRPPSYPLLLSVSDLEKKLKELETTQKILIAFVVILSVLLVVAVSIVFISCRRQNRESQPPERRGHEEEIIMTDGNNEPTVNGQDPDGLE